MSASVVQRMGPEAILEAVFAQAFAGRAFKLPAGVTRADLRAALTLEPSAQARIYEQIRAGFHAHHNAAVRQTVKPSGKLSWPVLLCAVLGMAFLAVLSMPRHSARVLTQPYVAPVVSPPSTPNTFVLATTPMVQPAPMPVALLLSRAAYNTDALAALQSRAATGEADAAYALATLLDSQQTQNEITLPKSDKVAFALYQQAARGGNIAAEFATGRAYQTGHGVAPDAALATAWFRAAALSGLAPAQTSLGFAYQTGLGITRDDTAAALWFSRAAAQADPAGETALGYLYLFGQGVDQDQLHGFALFSKAATQNFGPGFLALGYCYAQGLGTAQNLSLAAQYFLKASKSGVAQAGSALAMLVSAPVQAQPAAALALQLGTSLRQNNSRS
ncbi:MAG: sel1 repeat family protein [Rhodospirillales bacterium]|nr:sel1 repeat family protein [Rhodospirillales bacterium]